MSRARQTTYPALPSDRIYLCMGPMCWGADPDATKAIANAKKNRVKIYEGPRGWRYILFDVPAETTVDEMGFLCYELGKSIREVVRVNMESE